MHTQLASSALAENVTNGTHLNGSNLNGSNLNGTRLNGTHLNGNGADRLSRLKVLSVKLAR